MTTDAELKQARKAAYKKAKAAREADPKYQALKLQAKLKRQELYRAQRDALRAQKKKAQAEKIKAKDEELAQIFNLSAQLKLLKFE
jgi:hypothetical protein